MSHPNPEVVETSDATCENVAMIMTCEEQPAGIEWGEEVEDDQHVARTFLQGERSLAAIQNDPAVQRDLDDFLETAGDAPLFLSRGNRGEILIRPAGKSSFLLLTGKTADVLGSYLSGLRVTVEDRMDMTLRRGRND